MRPFTIVDEEFELHSDGDREFYRLKVRGTQHDLDHEQILRLYRILLAGAVIEVGSPAMQD